MLSDTELTELYKEIEALRAGGKEDEARQKLIDALPQLPQALQDEIILELVTASLETLDERRRLLEGGVEAMGEMLQNADRS